MGEEMNGHSQPPKGLPRHDSPTAYEMALQDLAQHIVSEALAEAMAVLQQLVEQRTLAQSVDAVTAARTPVALQVTESPPAA